MSTEDEKARYDRQIRVWGAEAQSRIQNSTVLLCGLRGLNVEVCKNIVLAGVNITIQDDSAVSVHDLSSNFFLRAGDVGQSTVLASLPRIQQLNSFATVTTETRSLDSLEDAFFARFTVVLVAARGHTQEQALRVDRLCRASSASSSAPSSAPSSASSPPPHAVFFLSDVFGDEATFFADFGTGFQYALDKKTAPAGDKPPTAEQQQRDFKAASAIHTMSSPALEAALAAPWHSLASRHFPLNKTFLKARLIATFRNAAGCSPLQRPPDAWLTHCSALLAAQLVDASFFTAEELLATRAVSDAVPVTTCSTLGSFLAQEVIKAVSRSGEPACYVDDDGRGGRLKTVLNVVVLGADFAVKGMPVGSVSC